MLLLTLRSESEFPKNYQYLCSVGIVFKLAHALLKLRPLANFDLRDYLDIVALGTVADLVPLIDENRILVKKGVENNGPNQKYRPCRINRNI